jgi:hypothetical protein
MLTRHAAAAATAAAGRVCVHGFGGWAREPGGVSAGSRAELVDHDANARTQRIRATLCTSTRRCMPPVSAAWQTQGHSSNRAKMHEQSLL